LFLALAWVIAARPRILDARPRRRETIKLSNIGISRARRPGRIILIALASCAVTSASATPASAPSAPAATPTPSAFAVLVSSALRRRRSLRPPFIAAVAEIVLLVLLGGARRGRESGLYAFGGGLRLRDVLDRALQGVTARQRRRIRLALHFLFALVHFILGAIEGMGIIVLILPPGRRKSRTLILAFGATPALIASTAIVAPSASIARAAPIAPAIAAPAPLGLSLSGRRRWRHAKLGEVDQALAGVE
jgi:hypothetical protein